MKVEATEFKSEPGMMPQWMVDKLPLLTETELEYLMMMWPKYGVLFITSKPGVAKSAIGLSIAKKLGMKYLDIRLSMSDESDFKYPFLDNKVCEDGTVVKVSGYAIPEWAFNSNLQPTIIHFEELNRAPQFVRNAALQILLERQIGDFKFNDNVLMMASGNMGEEDGTDVEEFDNALKNRLIHINHSLPVKSWLGNFAYDNCHKIITSYLENNPEQLYKTSDNTPGYATPRSWTMLSHFITKNWGMNAEIKDFLPLLSKVAHGYIGNCAVKFVTYCQDMANISIQDVINNYDGIKKELENYKRDKKSELIHSLKEIDVETLNTKQVENIIKFLKPIGEDEKCAYLLHLIDETPDIQNENVKNILLAFRKTLKNIKIVNNDGVDDEEEEDGENKDK